MGYKVFDDKMSFAEMKLRDTLEKTRSIQMMKHINRTINLVTLQIYCSNCGKASDKVLWPCLIRYRSFS